MNKTMIVVLAVALAPCTCFLSLFLLLLLRGSSESPAISPTAKRAVLFGATGFACVIIASLVAVLYVTVAKNEKTKEMISSYDSGDVATSYKLIRELRESIGDWDQEGEEFRKFAFTHALLALELGNEKEATDLVSEFARVDGTNLVLPTPMITSSRFAEIEEIAMRQMLPVEYALGQGKSAYANGDYSAAQADFEKASTFALEKFRGKFVYGNEGDGLPDTTVLKNLVRAQIALGITEIQLGMNSSERFEMLDSINADAADILAQLSNARGADRIAASLAFMWHSCYSYAVWLGGPGGKAKDSSGNRAYAKIRSRHDRFAELIRIAKSDVVTPEVKDNAGAFEEVLNHTPIFINASGDGVPFLVAIETIDSVMLDRIARFEEEYRAELARIEAEREQAERAAEAAELKKEKLKKLKGRDRVLSKGITREEWRAFATDAASYRSSTANEWEFSSAESLFQHVGQPDSRSTLGDSVYWSWKCTDGSITMIIPIGVANGGGEISGFINDF